MKNNDSINYIIIVGLLILSSISLLNSAYGYAGISDTSENWRIQPDTTLSFHMNDYINSELDTVIDDIVSDYGFDQLESDFWHPSKIDLNISSIDTNVSLRQLVDAFMIFTAPITCDQLINGTWQPVTSIIFPLAVPIDMWEDLESEFENAGSFYCEVKQTNSQISFVVGWYDSTDKYVYGTFLWSTIDGSLQEISYEIVDRYNQDTKDILRLNMISIRYPGDTKPPSRVSPIFTAIIVISAIGLGGVPLVLRFRYKHRLQYEDADQITSQHTSRNAAGINNQEGGEWGQTNNESMTSNYMDKTRTLEGYQNFRRTYLIRCLFFNGISIGSFFLGWYFIDRIGFSNETANIVIGISIGAIVLSGINVMLLNLPLIKFNKRCNQLKSNGSSSTNEHNSFMGRLSFKSRYRQGHSQPSDPSPMLTLVGCMIVTGTYWLLMDLDDIPTIGEKLAIMAMGVVFIGLLILMYWIFPFWMLGKVKEYALQVNYDFTSYD
ncbi:MAG: hypothetical protein ACTSYU_10655 [Promethearchaeota archaeon]